MFSTGRILPARMERYRTVAVWNATVARRAQTQSGSAAAQNVRGSAARVGNDRVAPCPWSLDSGVERMGISGPGGWRIRAADFPRARGWDARSKSHGGDGANPVGALELFAGRDGRGAGEGVIRGGDALARSLCKGMAVVDGGAGHFVDVLSGVARYVLPTARTFAADAQSSTTVKYLPTAALPTSNGLASPGFRLAAVWAL